jgi:hypothetical protein
VRSEATVHNGVRQKSRNAHKAIQRISLRKNPRILCEMPYFYDNFCEGTFGHNPARNRRPPLGSFVARPHPAISFLMPIFCSSQSHRPQTSRATFHHRHTWASLRGARNGQGARGQDTQRSHLSAASPDSRSADPARSPAERPDRSQDRRRRNGSSPARHHAARQGRAPIRKGSRGGSVG